MDWHLLLTMLLPAALGVYLFQYVISWQSNLLLIALFLFLNGVMLYTPQFLPGSNKDSRTLSRVEGILMGLGGAASVLPGISGVGAAMSVASVTGVERVYSLSMVLLMHLAVTAALIVFDILALFGGGMEALSFTILLSYLASAAAAFLGATVAIRLMRSMAAEKGFLSFAFYCWGLALLTFLLNLLA
jgi:undecaprenyl pyrophosphate phosphatase UppP